MVIYLHIKMIGAGPKLCQGDPQTIQQLHSYILQDVDEAIPKNAGTLNLWRRFGVTRTFSSNPCELQFSLVISSQISLLMSLLVKLKGSVENSNGGRGDPLSIQIQQLEKSNFFQSIADCIEDWRARYVYLLQTEKEIYNQVLTKQSTKFENCC